MTNKTSPRQVSYAPFLVGAYVTLFIGGLLYFSSVTKSEHARNASLFIAGLMVLPAVRAFQIQLAAEIEPTSSPLEEYMVELMRTPPKKSSDRKPSNSNKAGLEEQFKNPEQTDRYIVSRIIDKLAEIVPQPTPARKTLSPEPKKELQTLTAKFESLEAVHPKPNLTAPDYVNLGNAYYYESKFTEALDYYNKAIEINPDYSEASFYRGLVLGKIGYHEEEIAFYDKFLESKPDSFTAWDSRGYQLSKIGQYDKAYQSLNKAIELNPNYANAYYNRSYNYSLQGSIDLAIADLKKSIELDPKNLELARNDPDFDRIREDDRFKQLIQSCEEKQQQEPQTD